MSGAKHPPESSQLQRFKDLARELEADEDPQHFEETVRKIAPAAGKRTEPKDSHDR